MMMIEEFKKDINNSLKEIQENTGKQVEDLKEETQKSLKELQGNTIKEAKEINKTITKGDNPGVRKPRKEIRSHRCITNRIQEIEERISGAEDTIENIDTTVKDNAKCNNS